MKITTWYNTTQNKYCTEYRHFTTTHVPGYVNNQGHVLIGNSFFYRDKIFFSREALENFQLSNFRRAKKRVIRNLINFLEKL